MTAPLPPGVSSQLVTTPRGRFHLYTSGDRDGEPLLFLHGNVSSGRFFDETLATLPSRYRGIAPDLRGFGGTDPLPLDATRGLSEFVDDLDAIVGDPTVAPPGERLHLVGWSVGGAIAMKYAVRHPGRVRSITLLAPMSPVGFGGTRGDDGAPCCSDFAGSGGGTANPEFVRRIAAGDTSGDSPFSPRSVMNTYYFKPPFRLSNEREEVLVDEMLKTRTGDDFYPGDHVRSPNWPGVAPGRRGMNNTISPLYCNVTGFAKIDPRPPVLWVRGDADQIVSDTSIFDFGFLGQLGAVPGWPGEGAYPAQPMVRQTRAVLDAYRERGGYYQEEVLPGVGHSPHIEADEAFRGLLLDFLERHATETT